MAFGNVVFEKRDQILALAKQYKITNVRLFGSVQKGSDCQSSDVDFLVHLPKVVGLWELAGLHTDLETLLQKKVDLVPDNAHLYYPDILEQAVPL